MRRARFLVGRDHACKDLTECLLVQDDADRHASQAAPYAPYTPPVLESEPTHSNDGLEAMFDGMVLMCGHEDFAPAPPPTRAEPAVVPPEPRQLESEPEPEKQPEKQPEPERSLSSLPPPPPRDTVVRMVVPAGARAHDVLTLETASGQRVSMALPVGAAPGSTVQFAVQPSLWSSASTVVGKLATAAATWLGRLLDTHPAASATGGGSNE
eukprot:COSAG05_NODE_7078_length_859_cov_0.951316_1_plen_210_part_01